MNAKQVASLVRTVLKFGAGVLVAQGYLEGSHTAEFIGSGMALAAWLWSHLTHADPKETERDFDMGGVGAIGWILISGLCTAFAGMLLMGCGTLAPEGAYHGDKTLYAADKSIKGAYDTLHTFVKWEFDNRDALSKWPEIKQSADIVRGNAERWISSARALRDSYAQDPSAANKLSLENGLQFLQTALIEATKYMSKPLVKTAQFIPPVRAVWPQWPQWQLATS